MMERDIPFTQEEIQTIRDAATLDLQEQVLELDPIMESFNKFIGPTRVDLLIARYGVQYGFTQKRIYIREDGTVFVKEKS